MANIVSHVSTIKELVAATSSTNGGYKEIYLEADLDFNNEDYYYHLGNFFWTKGALTIDGGVYENGIVTRNHTLTNAYIFPKYSFMIIDMLNYDGKLHMSCNLKNIDFEVILNNAYFMYHFYDNSGGYSADPFKSKIENCNFNIKVTNIKDATSVFCNYASNSSTSNARQLLFVNCTFNIEITSSNISEFSIFGVINASGLGYSGYTSISFAFESCEFRIKNTCSNMKLSIFKRNYGDTNVNCQQNFFFNNCAFFLNNYYQPTGTSEIWLLNESRQGYAAYNYVWGYNSFFASFADTPDGTIDPDYKVKLLCVKNTWQQINLSSVFVDIDRINLSTDDPTKYPSSFFMLHTSECKDETKLKQIGFLFATES